MNDRERLSCNGIDGPLPETVQTWQQTQGAPERLGHMPVAEELGPEWTSLLGATGPLQRAWDTFWGMTRLHYWGPESDIVVPDPEIIADDGEYLTLRHANGAVVREMYNNAERYGMPEFIRYPLAGPEDWPAYRERWLPLEEGIYPQDWPALAARWRARDYPLAAGMPGTFGVLRSLLGTAQACTILYDAPDTARDILSHYRQRTMRRMERYMADIHPDCIGIGEDYCYRSGCFVSPALFREFFAPHYREIVDYGRAYGVRLFLVDSDGFVEGVVPLLEEVGINCLQAFEPRAGNDVVRVRARHPRFVIWGGLDKYVMDQRDPAVIDTEVDYKLPPLLAHGGYYPGIDHGLPPTTFYRSYWQLQRRLHELTGNPTGEFWRYAPSSGRETYPFSSYPDGGV
jgi:hypothetical protein